MGFFFYIYWIVLLLLFYLDAGLSVKSVSKGRAIDTKGQLACNIPVLAIGTG